MKKKIKMMLYGAPGVGKSTFAFKFPKPFFITTDGNYEWLEEFGAKEEDHIQINSWKEFVATIATQDFSDYDTIVVDLIEDLFQWLENEFCKKNKIDYIGDLGFGKGFKITRDTFFLEISKLLSKDKNIILLSHESSNAVKDKRGVETTLYYPSKIIPENLRDQIEGRLRYVLRAKYKDIVDGAKIRQKRILSLASDSSEFGIIRGVDMSKLSEEIFLDYDEFMKELGLNTEVKKPQTKIVESPNSEVASNDSMSVKEKLENRLKDLQTKEQAKAKEVIETSKPEAKIEEVIPTPQVETKKEEVVPTKKVETKKPVISKDDMIAKIKEKIRLSNEK